MNIELLTFENRNPYANEMFQRYKWRYAKQILNDLSIRTYRGVCLS